MKRAFAAVDSAVTSVPRPTEILDRSSPSRETSIRIEVVGARSSSFSTSSRSRGGAFRSASSVNRRNSSLRHILLRHGRAVDQGGEAGGTLDAIVMSPVPGERGPAAAVRARLQLEQPLATTGAPDADRHLVADQPPAAPRQNGWAASQTREVLLAPAGGESPDTAAVRRRCSSGSGRCPCRPAEGRWRRETVGANSGRNTERCPRNPLESIDPARSAAMWTPQPLSGAG